MTAGNGYWNLPRLLPYSAAVILSIVSFQSTVVGMRSFFGAGHAAPSDASVDLIHYGLIQTFLPVAVAAIVQIGILLCSAYLSHRFIASYSGGLGWYSHTGQHSNLPEHLVLVILLLLLPISIMFAYGARLEYFIGEQNKALTRLPGEGVEYISFTLGELIRGSAPALLAFGLVVFIDFLVLVFTFLGELPGLTREKRPRLVEEERAELQRTSRGVIDYLSLPENRLDPGLSSFRTLFRFMGPPDTDGVTEIALEEMAPDDKSHVRMLLQSSQALGYAWASRDVFREVMLVDELGRLEMIRTMHAQLKTHKRNREGGGEYPPYQPRSGPSAAAAKLGSVESAGCVGDSTETHSSNALRDFKLIPPEDVAKLVTLYTNEESIAFLKKVAAKSDFCSVSEEDLFVAQSGTVFAEDLATLLSDIKHKHD